MDEGATGEHGRGLTQDAFEHTCDGGVVGDEGSARLDAGRKRGGHGTHGGLEVIGNPFDPLQGAVNSHARSHSLDFILSAGLQTVH